MEVVMTEDWIKNAAAAEKMRDELAIINRQALFDALAAAGITSVTIEFNGYGDEGQIEDTQYFIDENETTPAIDTLLFVRQGIGSAPEAEPIELEDAMDELLYDLLSTHYCGWQDNEGSYGEFTFNIPARTVDLDIALRFVDANHYQHTV
jgi:hypothetical protein